MAEYNRLIEISKDTKHMVEQLSLLNDKMDKQIEILERIVYSLEVISNVDY